MTPEQYEKMGEAFLTLRRLPVAERSDRLSQLDLDETVREEVQGLLANDTLDGGLGFNEYQSLCSAEAIDAILKSATPSPPERIGRYAILETIGHGGMGIVFRAQQSGTRREVAVKLIRCAFLSPYFLRRFGLEAEALGRLQHPGIAQIFETNTAEIAGTSLPYVAMELVQGEGLLDYAKNANLSVRDRLELVLKICDAVQHAHQKGVIHRDIKPGNILVDPKGQPKILDFGVARIADPNLQQGQTLQTDAGQIIGTLAYMSPEQAAGDPLEIDIRCDVYSLGVVVFELLSAKLPHDLNGKPLAEALRIIREETPRRLRESDPSVPGDLEVIIGRALEPDKVRRYPSVTEFAADMQRFLRNEPISARRDSRWYVLRKAISRHRIAFAVTAVSLLMLVGFAITVAAMYSRQGRLLADAQREVKRRSSVNDFVQGMLASADPELEGREVKVVDILNKASKELNERLSDDPEVSAALHETMGYTYYSLGIYEPAAQHLQTAVEQFRSVPGGMADSARALNTLAAVKDATEQDDEAERLYRQSLEILKRELGPNHELVATVLNNLAQFLHLKRKDLAAAQVAFNEALEAARICFGEKSEYTAFCLSNYANLLRDMGQYSEAETVSRKALEQAIAVLGETHPQVASCKVNLADVLVRQLKHDGVEELYRDALSVRRSALGEHHPDVAKTLTNYADYLRKKGDAAGAEPLVRETLAIYEAIFEPEHAAVARGAHNLSMVLQVQRKPEKLEEAEQLAQRGLAIWKKQAPANVEAIATSLGNLGDIMIARDRAQDAVDLLQRELPTLIEQMPPGDWSVVEAEIALAKAYMANGQSQEGELYAESSLNRVIEALGPNDPIIANVRRILEDARNRAPASNR